MIDTNALIDRILSDLRERRGDKVYTDEPILRPASRMNNYLPPKYTEMRALAARRDFHFYENDAAVFYKQAVFMANHEDDCDYDGQFLRYFPTYRVLNDRQLRGYFSWRTKVRHGIVEKTALSFVYIYIYELLCLVGVNSPEEGFDTLLRFWHIYREIDPSVSGYLAHWLTDFYIYYRPDRPTDELDLDDRFDCALAVLKSPASHSEDTLFKALCTLSSYRPEISKFTKDFPDDVRTVTCRVFAKINEHHDKHCKKSFFVKLFGEAVTAPYPMFRSAVFYQPEQHENSEFALTPMQTYHCKNGQWYVQTGCTSRQKSKELGCILKALDSRMRRAYQYKTPLQEPTVTKLLSGILDREIAAFLKEKQQAQRPVIEIDLSKLSGIRENAAMTRDRLIVEEDRESDEPPHSSSCEKAVEHSGTEEPRNEQGRACRTCQTAAPLPHTAPAVDSPLPPDEYRFLQLLLYGGDAMGFAREKRLMLSVLADAINEALFDTFADTVIDFDGDTPVLIEDYLDKLKGLITP